MVASVMRTLAGLVLPAGLALASGTASAIQVTIDAVTDISGSLQMVSLPAGGHRAVMQPGSGWSYLSGAPDTWLTTWVAQWTENDVPMAAVGGNNFMQDTAEAAFTATTNLVTYLPLAEATDVGFRVGDNIGFDNLGVVILEIDLAGCGDGTLDEPLGEECDDGNALAGDGCDPTCIIEVEPTTTTTTSSTTSSTVASTTTTSIATTTSTTVSTSTTTTTAPPATTTTTTLPPSDCAGVPSGPTFPSLACRLEALVAQTEAESVLGGLREKLLASLAKATERVALAESRCAEARTKQAKARLKQAIRKLAQYSRGLRSRSAGKLAPEEVREPLAQAADAIRDDAKTLRGTIRCPPDAGGS